MGDGVSFVETSSMSITLILTRALDRMKELNVVCVVENLNTGAHTSDYQSKKFSKMKVRLIIEV